MALMVQMGLVEEAEVQVGMLEIQMELVEPTAVLAGAVAQAAMAAMVEPVVPVVQAVMDCRAR